MKIHISDPAALPELVEVLARRPSYVVAAIGGEELALSVLGSFADGGRMDIEQYLAPWRAARPDLQLEILALD